MTSLAVDMEPIEPQRYHIHRKKLGMEGDTILSMLVMLLAMQLINYVVKYATINYAVSYATISYAMQQLTKLLPMQQ